MPFSMPTAMVELVLVNGDAIMGSARHQVISCGLCPSRFRGLRYLLGFCLLRPSVVRVLQLLVEVLPSVPSCVSETVGNAADAFCRAIVGVLCDCEFQVADFWRPTQSRHDAGSCARLAHPGEAVTEGHESLCDGFRVGTCVTRVRALIEVSNC